MSHKHYKWDKYSDQPYSIQNKEYKKKLRLSAVPAFLKMLVVNILIMPFVSLRYFCSKVYSLPTETRNMIGLCVNEDKSPEATLALVEDLGVRSLSIRIPMSDVDDLQKYYKFISQFSDFDLLIVILQDRKNIVDKELCRNNFIKIFEIFKPLSLKFQIGNAINRTKWGFSSVDEYLSFYEIAYKINKNKKLGLTLFGSSVIDFEFYAIVRSLFNFYRLSYDGLSSLLYVDRRGAPENRQLNFSLPSKVLLIKCIAALSPKVGKRLVVSETNWVIENTEPYAPALDDVWVSEDTYANYLCRYFLLAMCTGSVETIYWHQLIAPGYGLIDNRNEKIIKRKGYQYFKTLIKFFSDVSLLSIEVSGNHYCVNARDQKGRMISALWTRTGVFIKEIPEGMFAYDAIGDRILSAQMQVSESVSYVIAS